MATISAGPSKADLREEFADCLAAVMRAQFKDRNARSVNRMLHLMAQLGKGGDNAVLVYSGGLRKALHKVRDGGGKG